MHKGLFLLVITSILISGCKKDNGTPGNSRSQQAKLVLLHGNGQTNTYGQDLTDSIVVQVVPHAGKLITQYGIKFNMLQGNGLIEGVQPGGYLNFVPATNSSLSFKWRLGCNNPNQKLTVYLYADSVSSYYGTATGPPDDSLVVSASGVKPIGWGRACGCGSYISYAPKVATFDKHTLYMANHGLFSSTDGGINWSTVTGIPNGQTINDVQFNSKGWMYVLTDNNGIYYTQDAKTWQAINNGILDMRTPTAFTVTDDLLFVSFYFDGPYMTSNNGGFWQKFLVGFSSQRYYLIKKHPNGNIYMFNDWTNLLVSKDTAKTWQLIPTSYNLVNYAAYDMEIGQDGNIYIGSDDATIATISPTGYSTYKSFYQYNSSTQAANNITFFNNDIYFLLNSNPQPGIYSVNNNWTRFDLGFDKTINYYFTRQDGSFLLFSYDGVYYKN